MTRAGGSRMCDQLGKAQQYVTLGGVTQSTRVCSATLGEHRHGVLFTECLAS